VTAGRRQASKDVPNRRGSGLWWSLRLRAIVTLRLHCPPHIRISSLVTLMCTAGAYTRPHSKQSQLTIAFFKPFMLSRYDPVVVGLQGGNELRTALHKLFAGLRFE